MPVPGGPSGQTCRNALRSSGRIRDRRVHLEVVGHGCVHRVLPPLDGRGAATCPPSCGPDPTTHSAAARSPRGGSAPRRGGPAGPPGGAVLALTDNFFEYDSCRPASTATCAPRRACAATESKSRPYDAATASSRSGRSPPGRRPMPGRSISGVDRTKASTPRITQAVSPRACKASAIDDFPDRGAPLRMTIWPGAVTVPLWKRTGAASCVVSRSAVGCRSAAARPSRSLRRWAVSSS